MSEAAGFFDGLAKSLKGELLRTRENLVPPAFAFLWEPGRYIVPFGGRSSAKSWSIARVLLVLAHESPLRILCTREIQGSLKESAHRLLADQIQALGLQDFYDVQVDSIVGRNGSRFFFEGLRYNASKIRSYEGCDIVWCEEAQSISELSFETLLPTVRKPGSKFFISFNPMNPDDPVMARFVNRTPPGTIRRKVSYKDNPFFSAESEAERAWLEQTDPDSHAHVWLGEPRTVSDAQILRGKYFVESFEVDPHWAGAYHGCDFGFSKDPSAAVRCHIDDVTRTLYISREFWQLGCDIDKLPGALEEAIPGISRHVVHCDSSRPETISYLQRNGIDRAVAAQKWAGSVDDGVAFLRSFARIVIDPSCVHTIDEARSYSFKCDRLTGQPLPEVEDKNNHIMDSIRYALWPLIKNLPTSGFFNRAALLVQNKPAEIPVCSQVVYGVLSASERAGTAAGFVIFAASPSDVEPRLTIAFYDLVEIEVALSVSYLEAAYRKVREVATEYRALAMHMPEIHVEQNEFGLAAFELAEQHAADQPSIYTMINLARIDREPIPSLDENCAAIRSTVNSGGAPVKFSRVALERQVTHRNATTNHLWAQVLSYQANAKDSPQELVAAFSTGISLWKQVG